MDADREEPEGPARDRERMKVLIAGGGVAGLEALLCLRDLAGPLVEIELLSPEPVFHYRPLAVAEPFGLGEGSELRLDEFAAEHGAAYRRDSLAEVDPGARILVTGSGERLEYGALLLALGVSASEWLPGSLTYDGAGANDAFRRILEELESGGPGSLVFAVPPTVRWGLPLYELALLTAHHLAESGAPVAELSVVSPESRPLEMFGERASRSVAALLAEAGIGFHGNAAPSAIEGSDLVVADGERIRADRVVSLPALEVRAIPGIPQGPHGFIGTDLHQRVEGVERVYAAGDATWFPIKQGGIASQQADVAASSIASIADPEVPKDVFRPVLRGALLTGSGPRFLRAEVGDRGGSSATGTAPLWWPPSKIAARHLGPHLTGGPRTEAGAAESEPGAAAGLHDLPPLHGEDPEVSRRDHEEAVELSLMAADADARWHDYGAALRWLEVAEQLDMTLPPEYAAKRARWRELL